MNRKIILALGAAVLMLAGCGGGDDHRPAATAEVPGSASQSVDGFIAYLKELVVAAADMLEPVDTSNVTPPTNETTEPATVD